LIIKECALLNGGSTRCLDDVDDEVRDRAAMYLKVIQRTELADVYVKSGETGVHVNVNEIHVNIIESVFSLMNLETKLVAYVKDPDAAARHFDVSIVPKISRAQAAQEAARKYHIDDLHMLVHVLSLELTMKIRSEHARYGWRSRS